MVSIVYASQSGFTKRYAQFLSSKIGCGHYTLANAPSVIEGGSDIIFMGWRSGPTIVGLKEAKKTFNVIAAVCVGLDVKTEKSMNVLRKKNGIDNIFYVRGGMDRSKLSGGQRMILGIVNVKTLIFNHSKEDEIVRKVMMKGGDLSSEDQLAEIEKWISENGI